MKNSFSLIETIVVIGIISVFIGIGTSVYDQSASIERFKKDVDMFILAFEKAHQKTISRDVSSAGTNSCTKFRGYSILLKPSTRSYVEEMWCDVNMITLTETTMAKTTITLPASETRYRFTYLEYPYGYLEGGFASLLTFRSGRTQQCINLRVSSTGNIVKSSIYSC